MPQQKSIEVILTRQLASYLAVPIFIVDPDGLLIFFNEPAERLLGMRFEETGEMPAGEWSTTFAPIDDAGQPIPPDRLPLAVAIAERRSVHGEFQIQSLDGVRKRISVTAFPLIGLSRRCLGGVAIFWERK
jgi:PAS domain-containing protein